MNKISANWSILQNRREARIGDLLLVTTNGRTEGGWGPVRWAVFLTEGDERVIMVEGKTFDGPYSALVRCAMLEAEQAASQLS